MSVFRLATISRNGQPRPVVLVENRIIDVQEALSARSMSAPTVEGRRKFLGEKRSGMKDRSL